MCSSKDRYTSLAIAITAKLWCLAIKGEIVPGHSTTLMQGSSSANSARMNLQVSLQDGRGESLEHRVRMGCNHQSLEEQGEILRELCREK